MAVIRPDTDVGKQLLNERTSLYQPGEIEAVAKAPTPELRVRWAAILDTGVICRHLDQLDK